MGKIAAVYVQEFDDGVALASAAEIETLTTGLSDKIWQKIAILSTVENQIAAGGSVSLLDEAKITDGRLASEATDSEDTPSDDDETEND